MTTIMTEPDTWPNFVAKQSQTRYCVLVTPDRAARVTAVSKSLPEALGIPLETLLQASMESLLPVGDEFQRLVNDLVILPFCKATQLCFPPCFSCYSHLGFSLFFFFF